MWSQFVTTPYLIAMKYLNLRYCQLMTILGLYHTLLQYRLSTLMNIRELEMILRGRGFKKSPES